MVSSEEEGVLMTQREAQRVLCSARYVLYFVVGGYVGVFTL